MQRIKRDELENCVQENQCWDCYVEGNETEATERPKRGKLEVPSCRKHFYEYKRTMSQLKTSKYARRAARKQEAERCVHPGCHNKLIPRELLPSWARERNCGMHGVFKAFRMSRGGLIPLIADHYVKEEERKGMRLQNIIYKLGFSFAFIGIQYPRSYVTQAWAASEVLRMYAEIRSKQSPRLGSQSQLPE
jgi:hypothetical protein